MSVPKHHPLYRVIPALDDVQAICSQFDIGPVLSVERDLGGQFNVNLKVITSANAAYVLRVHSGLATYERLHYIQTVVEELCRQGIPVIVPLKSVQGQPCVTYKGRFVQITPYVYGRAFSDLPEQVHSSGSMLRRIHKVLQNYPDGPTPNWSNYPSKVVLEEGLTEMDRKSLGISISQRDRAKRLYHIVMERWNRFDDTQLPRTVIHGDWHFFNSLYDDTGEVKAVLDFDFVDRAERLHDIAYALWILMSQPKLRSFAGYFLRGYGPLTQEEVEMLPVAIARAALFFVCTASFTSNPAKELQDQLKKQETFIEWVCSEDGRRTLHNYLPAHRIEEP